MLLQAQTCVYAALGLFVATGFVSVVGAALSAGHPAGYDVAVVISAVMGFGAAAALVYGCSLLVRETRLALESLHEDITLLDARTTADAGPGAAGG
jgi:hypothetical protein